MAEKRPKLVTSRRALARVVGRSESAVRKWFAHDAWPFGSRGPWDPALVLAWMEMYLQRDQAAAWRKKTHQAETGVGRELDALSAGGKAKLQYMIERTLLVRQRRLADAGKLHDTDECQRRRTRQIHVVKARLLELPASLAGELEAQPRDEIERRLRSAVTAILEDYAHGVDA